MLKIKTGLTKTFPTGTWAGENDFVQGLYKGWVYVLIPKNSKWASMSDSELESKIDCHGGVTYSGMALPDGRHSGTRCVGFDLNHYMDYSPHDEQFALVHGIGTYKSFCSDAPHYRDEQYVINQCQYVIEQLLPKKTNGKVWMYSTPDGPKLVGSFEKVDWMMKPVFIGLDLASGN